MVVLIQQYHIIIIMDVVLICLYVTLSQYHLNTDLLKAWISKMLFMYILPNVCLTLHQLISIIYMQDAGLCVFSLTISLMMTVRIYVFHLIFIIGSLTSSHCYFTSAVILFHRMFHLLYIAYEQKPFLSMAGQGLGQWEKTLLHLAETLFCHIVKCWVMSTLAYAMMKTLHL